MPICELWIYFFGLQASQRAAGGIVEALSHFKLLPVA